MSTAPETAEDIINTVEEAPGYVGTLDPQEHQLLRSLNQARARAVQEIGQLEVKKAMMIGRLSDMDQRGSEVMTEAAARFGVDGSAWSISDDGKVYAVQPPNQPES